jgi:hypothetical protein
VAGSHIRPREIAIRFLGGKRTMTISRRTLLISSAAAAASLLASGSQPLLLSQQLPSF